METKKSKVFTRKVTALFLAVLMAAASFTGVLTAYATKSLSYHDDALYANAVAWVEASSDQTCEALLDSADDLISGLDLDLSTLAGGILGTGDHVSFAIAGLSLEGYIDNLDGVIDLLIQVRALLKEGVVQNLTGDLKNLKTDAIGAMNTYSTATSDVTSKCGKSYRAKLDAKQIIIYVLQFLHDNMGTSDSTVLYDFLNGGLSIGSLIEGIINGDIYSLLQGLLGAPDGYQNDVAYNILKALLINNLDCYPDKDAKLNDSNWNFDTEAFETILPYYLNKLSFNITYPNYVNYDTDGYGYTEEKDGVEVVKTGWGNDCSKRRYLEMQDYMSKNGASLSDAIAHFASTKGWDANLAYNTEEGYEGNILVTQYGGKQLTISKSQSIYTIIWNALPTVWKTAGEPTLGLVHVNFNGGETAEGSVGSNYDNAYFYWYVENIGDWDTTNWEDNYDHVQDWAADVYDDYGVADAATFLNKVKMVLKYDRYALNENYNWRDIDSTKLFNEIRFSPLAAVYFNMQTGPLNLYFEQTGAPTISNFINSHIDFSTMRFTGYTGVIDAINDAAVAAMGDLFPTSQYVGEQTNKQGAFTPTSLPALTSTGTGKTNAQIVETLMSNAATVFQYAADATDANILNPYYHNYNNGQKTAITEQNFMDAAIPFAISALKNWNITASIHNSDWDKVKDIEGMAVIALKEYLGYLFPDRDYEAKGLWTYDADGFITATSGTNLFDKAIIPMAADAVGFVLTAAGVPFFTNYSFSTYQAGQTPSNLWDPYTMSFTDSGMGTGINNKFFDYLNTVVVYFGDHYGFGALANLNGQISSSNTIWQNLDLIINAYLPVIGSLQGRGSGNASTYQLLWNDIVLGVVNMGDTDSNRANPSEYGFSNLLTIVANIFTSAPIKDENVEYAVVFDIVKPLVNKLLGSRGSTTRNIINVGTSDTTPINTFLHKSALLTSLYNLLYNIYEAFSVSSQGASASWKAVSAILQFTNLLPKLRDNDIGGVSATLTDTVQANVESGYSIVPTKLTIRNESWGLNRFYKDSSGKLVEAGRYYANNIETVKVTDANGNDVTNQFTIGTPSGTLDPEEREVLSVSGSPSVSDQLFTFTVTYGMYRSDVLGGSVSKTYTNLKAKAYMYITSGSASDKKWSDVYGAGTVKGISDQYVAEEGSDNGLTNTTDNSGDSLMTVPDLLILGAGNSDNANGYSYRITNTGSAQETVSEQYAYPAAGAIVDGVKLEYDDTSMAYVALDKDGYVHCTDGSTVAAAQVANNASGVVTNADGSYEAILVDPSDIGENGTYKAGTPIAGLFLNREDGTIDEYVASDPENDIVGNPGYEHFAIFDGQGSEMTEGVYHMGLAVSIDSGSGYHYAATTIAVGNIESAYNEYKSLADGYDNYYSSFTSIAQGFRRAINTAKSRTVFDGVNIGNLEDALQMETYLEELKTAAEDPRAVGTDYAAAIHNNVSVPRRGKSNVDYTVTANYERAVDAAQSAEALLIGEPVMVTVEDVDENGDPVYDEDTGEQVTHEEQAKDEDGYPLYTYTSTATSVQLQEAARLYSVYNASDKVVRRAYMGDLIEEEVVHATSVVDDSDIVVPATATSLSDFTYTEDTDRGVHRFYLSTKDEDELDNVKSYNVGCTASTVRFGKVENGALVNDGYNADLWNCYVDALGECLNAVSTQDTVSKTYDAKSHLIMAENALLLADQEDTPTPGEGIPFSGTIRFATDYTGTNYGGVVPNVNILDANGDIVATSAADGTFSFTADPTVGTTFTVQGTTTFDRTITIAGTEDEISDVVIPVVAINYSGRSDSAINVSDLGEFYSFLQSQGTMGDIDGSGNVNVSDLGEFYKFIGKTSADVNYGKLAFEA